MTTQDKVITNVIRYMEELKIDENYILEHSSLTKKRLRTILNIGAKRRITISEVNQISKAIGVDMYKLFSIPS